VAERRFHGPRDYLDAARAADATSEELAVLARSEYDFVRLAVAEHPASTAAVLQLLVPESSETWNDQALLLALAAHPNSPLDVLEQVAQRVPSTLHNRDRPLGFAAGIELFKRADTPLSLLFTLLEDEQVTTEFRKVAARETTRGEVVEVLLADRSERVRRAAARRA
jgi:hypothetical protein